MSPKSSEVGVLASCFSSSGLWDDVETHHPFLEFSVPLRPHSTGVLAERAVEGRPGWRITRPFEPDASYLGHRADSRGGSEPSHEAFMWSGDKGGVKFLSLSGRRGLNRCVS